MYKVVLSIFLLILSLAHAARAQMDKTGTLWAPYVEWSFANPTYAGNPFDLVASATFTHSGSGESRTTEMFYAGSNTWKLRFTGTRTGMWTFVTTSTDSDLDGLSGTVSISPNSDPKIKGFLTSSGNKFARQIGENGELKSFIFNVYQSSSYQVSPYFLYNNPSAIEEIDKGVAEIQKFGATVLYSGIIGSRWFKLETQRWDEHNSENPDMRTFEALELAITSIHSKGSHLHIWAWGDEERRQTPIGVGGINGIPDRRVQRYIAARLGPLPGWTMGYGFDLQEWVSEIQIQSWAAYLHSRFGWQHLLWGRGRFNAELNVQSYSGSGPNSYTDVVVKMNSDLKRPHIYEERFIYQRWGKYDMQTTRRQMWWNIMAGGMGSWWGRSWDTGEDYPSPEQMRAHNRFWERRFLLDMAPANSLTDGYGLKTPANTHYVFYKENASSIQMDLSQMVGTKPAVAIDTKKDYAEIEGGTLNPTSQTWSAPYQSDWAIAVGVFGQDTTPAPDTMPPTAPTTLTTK